MIEYTVKGVTTAPFFLMLYVFACRFVLTLRHKLSCFENLFTKTLTSAEIAVII